MLLQVGRELEEIEDLRDPGPREAELPGCARDREFLSPTQRTTALESFRGRAGRLISSKPRGPQWDRRSLHSGLAPLRLIGPAAPDGRLQPGFHPLHGTPRQGRALHLQPRPPHGAVRIAEDQTVVRPQGRRPGSNAGMSQVLP